MRSQWRRRRRLLYRQRHEPCWSSERQLQFFLKKIVGVGLLVVGLLSLATGMTCSYVGLTTLEGAILLVGDALLDSMPCCEIDLRRTCDLSVAENKPRSALMVEWWERFNDHAGQENPLMKYRLTLLLLVCLVTTMTFTESYAQAGRGAVSGAIIGGAVGGRRGAAIGATAGAIAGSRHRHWHNYYWRHGQCWYRSRSGRSHAVSHRYCR